MAAGAVPTPQAHLHGGVHTASNSSASGVPGGGGQGSVQEWKLVPGEDPPGLGSPVGNVWATPHHNTALGQKGRGASGLSLPLCPRTPLLDAPPQQ